MGVVRGVHEVRAGEPGDEQESDEYTLRGKITGAKASGRFSVNTKDFAADGSTSADCSTGTITFKATSG